MSQKIAICFYGLPRSSSVTLPTIFEHILEPLKEYEVKIFSVFNYQQNIQSERSNENNIISQSNYDFFESHRHLFLEPSSYFDEQLHARLLKLGDSWKNNGLSLKFHLMQLYTIEKVYELAKEEFNPDYFLFIRPDLFIHEKLPLEKYIKKKSNSDFVLIPSWQWWSGVNDRFCFASKLSAPTFATRYTRLLKRKILKSVHSESDLEIFFKDDHIKLLTFDSRMSRVRAGGEFASENFDPLYSTLGWRRRLKAKIYNIEICKGLAGLWRFIKHPILFIRYEN